jgi:hypothetical protein
MSIKTEVPSPKSRLLAYSYCEVDVSMIGLAPGGALARLGYHFRCGDIVREKDGRHEARIDARLPTLVAKVTWIETGWKGELPLAEIEKVNDGRRD